MLFFTEMTNRVSGVILLLMTSLRQTYSGDKKDDHPKERSTTNETFISILDGGAGESKGKLYSAALQAILKGLVMWIIGELDFLFVKSYFKMPWSF